MNPVQAAQRAAWTGFMNAPATAFGDLSAILAPRRVQKRAPGAYQSARE
jgi:hypothetical protein